jgi:chromosome segregation ATPase
MASLGDATRDDCEKLEQLAMKAMNDLKECRSNRRSLAEESRYLNKQMKSLTVQIPKLSMEIASCDTTREELSNRLPSLRGQCSLSAGDAVKLAELNKNVRKRKTEMGSCALQASKLETEVSKIQKAILDAGGAKLKKQQGKCDKILSDINETTKEINTAKVLISSSEKAVTKAKKAKETAEEDFEKSKTQLEEKKGLFKALEEEAFGVMQAFEEVKEIESEKKKALKEVSTECDALKKSQTQIKCKEVDISAKLESCEKSVSDNANRMKHWDNERNKILRAEEDDDDYDSEESDGEENDEEKRAIDEEMKDVDDTDGDEKPKKKECLLPTLPHNALEQYSQEEVKQDILRLDKERQEMAKNANMAAIEEYRKKEGDYLSR